MAGASLMEWERVKTVLAPLVDKKRIPTGHTRNGRPQTNVHHMQQQKKVTLHWNRYIYFQTLSYYLHLTGFVSWSVITDIVAKITASQIS
jgi:hypothetical protein